MWIIFRTIKRLEFGGIWGLILPWQLVVRKISSLLRSLPSELTLPWRSAVATLMVARIVCGLVLFEQSFDVVQAIECLDGSEIIDVYG